MYLATDPDREGEAIAWHLAYILEIPEDEVCRVTFNEITKEAIQKSIKSPRKIDKDLTDAQQARRVLDRIVGYKISPILWKKRRRNRKVYTRRILEYNSTVIRTENRKNI